MTMTDAYAMGLPKDLARSTLQLVELLKERYPEQQWDKMFTMQGRFGQQRRLEQAVTSLFPVCTSSLIGGKISGESLKIII